MRGILALTLAALVVTAGPGAHAQAPADAANPAAPSPEMSVSAFLSRLGELARTGPLWPGSPEGEQLIGILSTIGKTYRQDLADRRAAGQPVEACLPAEAEIDSAVLLEHLSAYPPETASRTSMAEAFSALVRKRFPCA